MPKSAFYRFTVLGAIIMALLFTGNRLRAGAQTVPEGTQVPPVSSETQDPPTAQTTLETQPETELVTEAETEPVTEAETQPPTEEEPKLLTLSEIQPDGFALRCSQVSLEADDAQVFVYDAAGDRMLYCSGPEDETVYPASITKLFTAYTALRLLPGDTVVTAGWELGLLKPGSSYAGIGMDSKLTVEMLVEAMLLPSGNDAAYVLAAAAGRAAAGNQSLGPSAAVGVFVEQMNEMGQEVGLVNTHFVNPDGYHDSAHYSCPRDLARIGALALNDPVIAQFASMSRDTVRFVSGESVTWDNTNRLLNPDSELYCPESVGLKTGYTNRAGFCLLSAFRRGDRQVLVGIFGAKDKLSRYSDAAALWQAVMTAMDDETCG